MKEICIFLEDLRKQNCNLHCLKHYHKHSKTPTSLIQTHLPKQGPSTACTNWEESRQKWGCDTRSHMKGRFLDNPLQLKSSAEATHFQGKGAFWSTGTSCYCTQACSAEKSRNKAFEVVGKHLQKHTDFGEKQRETEGRRCAIMEILALAKQKTLKFKVRMTFQEQ